MTDPIPTEAHLIEEPHSPDDPPPPHDDSSALLVSDVARNAQKRHESTQRAAEEKPPEFILEIEQSDVAYTVPPQMMPLGHVNYEVFTREMRDRWDLEPDLSSLRIDPSLPQQVAKEVESTGEDFDAALIRHALKDRDAELMFRGGRYRLSDSEFVPINAVKVNFESVIVSVGGIEKVAESVAAEIFELIAASAGLSRPWKTTEEQLRVVGYATKTRVDLGSDNAFEDLLSPKLIGFMDSEMVAGERFAAHYGSYHSRDDLKAPSEDATSLSWSLDDLHFYISQFDKRTGMVRQGQIRFTVTGRGDYRSGVVSIWSEFPYEIHKRFVGQLIQATQAAK